MLVPPRDDRLNLLFVQVVKQPVGGENHNIARLGGNRISLRVIWTLFAIDIELIRGIKCSLLRRRAGNNTIPRRTSGCRRTVWW